MIDDTRSNAPQIDVAFGIVAGRPVRFFEPKEEQEGHDGPVYLLSKLSDMPLEDLGKLYGMIAGTTPKHFKSMDVAVESVAYQVHKLYVYDPNAPKVVPQQQVRGSSRKALFVDSGETKTVRRAPSTYELLTPPDVDKVLRSLAPQAREIVAIMAELVAETKSNTFSETALEERLKRADVVERLRTRQEPTRILQYYKGKLITVGMVKLS